MAKDIEAALVAIVAEHGIIWDRMDPHMYDTIPPLQELKSMGL